MGRKRKHKKWERLSLAEQRWFKAHVNRLSWAELSARFGVPQWVLREWKKKAFRRDIARREQIKRFALYNPLSLVPIEMRMLIGVSYGTLTTWYKTQRAEAPMLWDTDAEEFLELHWEVMTPQHLATCLGCTPKEVRDKALEMSLGQPVRWTSTQDRQLLQWAGRLTFAEMAARLGMSEQTVRNRFTEKRLYYGLS